MGSVVACQSDVRAADPQTVETAGLTSCPARPTRGCAGQARDELTASIRATPLDPGRPALDLLADLLDGIRGCWLMFSEYVDDAGPELADDDQEESEDEGANKAERGQDTRDALTGEFIDAVRAEAEGQHDRLLKAHIPSSSHGTSQASSSC
jgi:hypothetical protein